MNKRDALFVGLSLLGSFLLVQVVVQAPTLLILIVEFFDYGSSQAASNYGFNALVAVLLQACMGLFLLLKASQVSDALVRRDARCSRSLDGPASPPTIPTAER
ncbi:MAG: hypothetical protein ACI82F_004415 [Planctomycetota bacterium]|jgi:hypothetical protein